MATAVQTRRRLTLGQLSPEAQQAAKTRTLTGAIGVRQLVRVLGELAHLDEHSEQQMKLESGWIGLFVLTAVLSTFTAAISPVFLIIPGILLLFAIRHYGAYRRAKRNDLPDDLRLCLRPVLRDIAADIDAGQKIRLRLDLSGPVKAKMKHKRQLPPGHFQKLEETLIEDPWCEMKLPLADGSTVDIEITYSYFSHARRYRASSGKTKWKTKSRKECMASATLTPPRAAAWNEKRLRQRVDGACEKLRCFEKNGVTCARLERYWTFKAAGAAPKNSPPPQEIVGMLVRLYAAMNAAPEQAR